MTLTATERKHISYTQLDMYLRCGQQYYRRYVQGQVIPPSAALVRGSSCHGAEKANFLQKIKTKEDLPLETVRDAFSDLWEAEKYSIAFAEEELDGESPAKALGRWKDSGVGLVSVFHREIAPTARPSHVEQDFAITFEGGYPPLIGYMDRIDAESIIAEQKFVGKSPPAEAILTDIQMTTYDLGFRVKFGRPPVKLVRECAVATKTPKTNVQECGPRDDATIDHLLFRLEMFLVALEKGVFLPAGNGHWCCSPKWCGYYHTCKYRQ